MEAKARALLFLVTLLVIGPVHPAHGQAFEDTNGSSHQEAIEAIAGWGITRGCNPPENDRYCPEEPVTRGQMAAFLVRAFAVPRSDWDFFSDDGTSTFQADINDVAGVWITRGCNPPRNDRYCPDEPVTRGQMAAFLTRTLELGAGTGEDFFSDDDTTGFEADIDRLAKAGITRGCNPPENDDFCPDRPVTRAEMATFLVRALEHLECGEGAR